MSDSDTLTAEDCREIAVVLNWRAVMDAAADAHEGTDNAARLRKYAQHMNDLAVRLHANPAYLTDKDNLRAA